MPSLMRLLIHAAARLPLSLLHTLGAVLGEVLWRIPNGQRRTTLLHLSLCLPEIDRGERRKIARASLRHSGRMLLESPWLWFAPADKVLARVRSSSGEELVDEALRAGRPVILVTPHLGAWEMAGLYCSRLHSLTSLYKPQAGAVDAIIREGRQRFGAHLVPSDGAGVKYLLQALRRHDMAGILPDQDPPRGGGLFAHFFGIPAHTSALVSKLARRTEAVVVMTYAERLPRAGGYRMHFLRAPRAVCNEQDLEAANALNRAVEMLVRRQPEQYWWGYRRFRRQPPGAKPIYRTP